MKNKQFMPYSGRIYLALLANLRFRRSGIGKIVASGAPLPGMRVPRIEQGTFSLNWTAKDWITMNRTAMNWTSMNQIAVRAPQTSVRSASLRSLLPALAALLLCGLMPVEAQQKKQPEKKAPAKEMPAAPGGGQTFLIGTFGDWKALMTGKDKQKVCYALSQPKERLPAKLVRDPGYLFISNRTADGAKNEIAFKLGFAAKTGQDGSLTIGTGNFQLVASGESAFLKNPAQEAQLIDLMKRGAGITIKVASVRGNETTDKYSLNGFGKALEAVARECP